MTSFENAQKSNTGRGGPRRGAGRPPKKPPVDLATIVAQQHAKEQASPTKPSPKVDFPEVDLSDPDQQEIITPMEFMTKIMQNRNADVRMRFEAAKVLLPFTAPKLGEKGKKEQLEDAAGQITKGSKFKAVAPPKSVAG